MIKEMEKEKNIMIEEKKFWNVNFLNGKRNGFGKVYYMSKGTLIYEGDEGEFLNGNIINSNYKIKYILKL